MWLSLFLVAFSSTEPKLAIMIWIKVTESSFLELEQDRLDSAECATSSLVGRFITSSSAHEKCNEPLCDAVILSGNIRAVSTDTDEKPKIKRPRHTYGVLLIRSGFV